MGSCLINRSKGVGNMEQKIVGDCVFYIHDDEVAVEIAEIAGKIKSALYDGRNTLLMIDENKVIWLLRNIVLEVRNVLVKADKLFVIKRDEKDNVADGYSVRLDVNESFECEDNFAENCCDVYNLVEGITE